MSTSEYATKPAPRIDSIEHNTQQRMAVAARLSAVAKHRGYSMRRLAELTGVDHSSISRYMSGKTMPTIFTLHELCKILDVAEDWVIAGVKHEPPAPCPTCTNREPSDG